MSGEILHKMIVAHRYLRHDFMNDLQVVSGYLQIGQAEKALIYTKKLASSMEVFNPLAKLTLPLLQSYFLSYITLLSSNREYFTIIIDGDMSSWQEDEYYLTRFMKDLFDPLYESIIERDLEIKMKILKSHEIEIKFLCNRNELVDKLAETAKILKNSYQEKLEISAKKKDSTLLVSINSKVTLSSN
jgi:hypothetical protein